MYNQYIARNTANITIIQIRTQRFVSSLSYGKMSSSYSALLEIMLESRRQRRAIVHQLDR